MNISSLLLQICYNCFDNLNSTFLITNRYINKYKAVLLNAFVVGNIFYINILLNINLKQNSQCLFYS